MDPGNQGAGFHFRTIPARIVSPCMHAFSYFTQVAMTELRAFFPAPCAVDHFPGQVRVAVIGLPPYGGGFPEFIVISDSSISCVTGCAIQAAAGNELFHY